MGYPENVLAKGEQVVLHHHPHWKRLIWPVVVLFLATGLAAFGSGYVNSTHWGQPAKNVVYGVIWAIWVVVVGWLTLWPFLTWRTTHFVVTNRRVMFRHGVADPQRNRHPAGADQQRGIPGPAARSGCFAPGR